MKFKITKEELQKILNVLTGITQKKHTVPILSNLYICVENDKIDVISTDLEIEIRISQAIDLVEPGTITIPAKKFIDICRNLPNESIINFHTTEKQAILSTGKIRFHITTLPSDNFPLIDDKNICNLSFACPQGLLKDMLLQTSYAIAEKDVRYCYNGLLFELSSGFLTTVATNGYRLSKYQVNFLFPFDLDKPLCYLFPRKTVNEITRLLTSDSDKTVTIKLGPKHVIFIIDGMTIISRLLNGEFPSYRLSIPTTNNQLVKISYSEIKSALNRIMAINSEISFGISLLFENDMVFLTFSNSDYDQSEESISAEFDCDSFKVFFNCFFLNDIINVINSEYIIFMFSKDLKSCLIQGDANENCVHLLMPVKR